MPSVQRVSGVFNLRTKRVKEDVSSSSNLDLSYESSRLGRDKLSIFYCVFRILMPIVMHLMFVCNNSMQGMMQGHSVPSLGQGRLCSQPQQNQPQSR